MTTTINQSLSGVVAAILLLAASPAWALGLKVSNVEAPSGGEIEIELQAEDADDLGPVQMLFLFDSNVLEIVEVEAGDVYEGSIESKAEATGELSILMLSDSDEGVQEDGTIAVIRAKVLGQPGDKSELGLRHIRAWKRDTSNPVEFDVVTTEGELTVVPTSFPWWLIAAICGGAILMLGLIVVAGRRGRNKQTSPHPSSHTSATVTCPHCGQANSPSDGFCGGCGQPLGNVPVASAACAKCGAQLDPGKKFCTKCGTAA